MAKAPRRSLPAHRRQGQPLVFLATVVLLWSLARIVQHWPDQGSLASVAPPGARETSPAMLVALRESAGDAHPTLPMASEAIVSRGRSAARAAPLRADLGALPFDIAMAHQQLWIESQAILAGSQTVPGRGSPLVDRPLMLVAERPVQPPILPPGVRVVQPGGGRWSVYGWSLLRANGRTRSLAPVAQYGGSQAGLVVQMVLADSPQRPFVYARATSALESADDRTLAFGLAARPVPVLPVDLAVERRISLSRGQPDRFAAMLVGGAAWKVPHSHVRAEAYGQAGVVGLADGHAFFDLQMLATRPVLATDAVTVSLGGGVWAGGQQNRDAHGGKPWTHRIDLGPRAAIAVPAGTGSLSFALDWRQRVDGDAAPDSGAALTLSAGF